MIETLLIRADGNSLMGTGHIMRCLSLAQGWARKGGKSIFVMAEAMPALEERLQAENLPVIRVVAKPGSVEDASETILLAKQNSADWIVVDGYHFDSVFQRQIKDAGLRLLVLDDYGHAQHYFADLLVNQNLSAREEWYKCREPYTKLLLGARYVLLREQFMAYRNWRREIVPVARKVLVTLGGADPGNVTCKLIKALQGLDVDVKIVVGAVNTHLDQIRSVAAGFTVLTNVSNMPELMAWADVAVAAGGTTSWELAFMGLPSVVLVLADNQRLVAEALEQNGLAILSTVEKIAVDLPALLVNASCRAAIAEHARHLVDGEGFQRVAVYLRGVNLTLRRAQPDDCKLMWTWSNDPEVRAVSLSSVPIQWETHVKWFGARMKSPECLIYMAMNRDRKLIGQIRFEICGNEAIVSVLLTKEARGLGYGPALIVRGSEQCFVDSAIGRIHAYIKPSNVASILAFDRAGFRDVGDTVVDNQTVRQYILAQKGGT